MAVKSTATKMAITIISITKKSSAITSISKYDSNIQDNNIDNKNEGYTISRNGCGRNTSIISIDNNSKEVNIYSNDGSRNISNDNKGKSIKSTPRTRETKSVRQKNLLSSLGIA